MTKKDSDPRFLRKFTSAPTSSLIRIRYRVLFFSRMIGEVVNLIRQKNMIPAYFCHTKVWWVGFFCATWKINDWTELGVGPSTDGWSKFLSMFKTFTLDTALSKASGRHYISQSSKGTRQAARRQSSRIYGKWATVVISYISKRSFSAGSSSSANTLVHGQTQVNHKSKYAHENYPKTSKKDLKIMFFLLDLGARWVLGMVLFN